jgi:Apea-like HEPN
VSFDAASAGELTPESSTSQYRTTKRDAEADKIQAAEMAFYLAAEIRPGTEVLLFVHVGEETREIDQWRVFRRPVVTPSIGHLLTAKHLEAARGIFQSLQAIPRSGPLWTALRMASFGLDELRWEIPFSLNWIALEALFGPKGSEKIIDTIANRIASFLEDPSKTKKERLHETKDAYVWRSKVLHGRVLYGRHTEKKRRSAQDALDHTGETIWWALRKILLDKALVSEFENDSKRQAFFLAMGCDPDDQLSSWIKAARRRGN